MRMVYSVLVKWPEQPIRQHIRLTFDEFFTAMCRTLSSSDSLESYGSERLSGLLGWPSLYHRSFCEHCCDQRVGRSPQRARPVQISWSSRCFFRSMSVQDSQSRRFEQTFGRVFLRPILAQDRPRNYFFRVFFNV